MTNPTKHHQKTLKQVAALPYRGSAADREILLLTSRRTGRLIIPKGWTMRRMKSARAAEIEAFEEAGVRGNVARKPVGHFTYDKEIGGSPVKVRVAVFPLKVRREDPEWKEDSVRQRMWLPQMDAADAVSDPELGELLRVF